MKRLLFSVLGFVLFQSAIAQNCTTITFDGSLDSAGEYVAFTGKTNGLINGSCNSNTFNVNTTILNPTAANAPNSNFNLTLVSSGLDGQVEFFAGDDPQDGNSISLRRTYQGSGALRINQNRGFNNYSLEENQEVDFFAKRFTVLEPEISFHYASVSEYDAGTYHKLPYFLATLRCLDDNVEIDNDCYEADINHSDVEVISNLFSDINPAQVQHLIIKDWDEMTLNAGNHIDHDVELRLESADCSNSVHGSYTYVDNITYCGEEISECENVCDAVATINVIENPLQPCRLTLVASSDSDCEELSYQWTVDGIVYNQMTVPIEFVDNNPIIVCLLLVDQDGNICEDTKVCESIAATNCVTEDCPDCDDIDFTVSETDDCKIWQLEKPLIDNTCYSATINWGDSSISGNINLDGGIQNHTYQESGNYIITITLTDPDGISCTKTYPIEVDCETDCIDPCELDFDDLEININYPDTRDGCDYIFDVNLGIDACFDGYFSYFWSITDGSNTIANFTDGQTTSTTSSFAYDFSNDINQTYIISVFIIYYSEDGTQRLCSFKASRKEPIYCGQECGDPCNLDLTINDYTDNGCEYTFIPEIQNECPGVTYEYAWGIVSEGTSPLSYDENFTFQFTQSAQEIIMLTIIATTPEGKVCDKQTFSLPLNVECSNKKSITIYPNPTKSNKELYFEGIDYRDLINVEIFDMYGNSKMKIKPKQNVLSIRKLNSGIYFVRFNTSYNSIIERLIIE